MKRNEFVEYLIGDQLASIPGMSAKAMFGGFGIYLEGTIVGIVAEDELYLKVDETNQSVYEAMGSTPFQYSRKGHETTMSYWKVPSEVLEDRERLLALVVESYEVNLKRSVEKSQGRSPKKTPRRNA